MYAFAEDRTPFHSSRWSHREHPPQLGQEILRQARFREKQVASGSHRTLAFPLPGARRDHDHGNGARPCVALQPGDELDAVEISGKENAGDDGLSGTRNRQSVPGSRDSHRQEAALPEAVRIHLAAVGVGLNDHNELRATRGQNPPDDSAGVSVCGTSASAGDAGQHDDRNGQVWTTGGEGGARSASSPGTWEYFPVGGRRGLATGLRGVARWLGRCCRSAAAGRLPPTRV